MLSAIGTTFSTGKPILKYHTQHFSSCKSNIFEFFLAVHYLQQTVELSL